MHIEAKFIFYMSYFTGTLAAASVTFEYCGWQGVAPRTWMVFLQWSTSENCTWPIMKYLISAHVACWKICRY